VYVPSENVLEHLTNKEVCLRKYNMTLNFSEWAPGEPPVSYDLLNVWVHVEGVSQFEAFSRSMGGGIFDWLNSRFRSCKFAKTGSCAHSMFDDEFGCVPHRYEFFHV
jgi:hypothetical protein